MFNFQEMDWDQYVSGFTGGVTWTQPTPGGGGVVVELGTTPGAIPNQVTYRPAITPTSPAFLGLGVGTLIVIVLVAWVVFK